MENHMLSIIVSIFIGVLSRAYMMKIDHRQYPSYPQGFLSHITLGLIAASLGAVAIPALSAKEFGAVTFLSLAAQQFRDVRNMERQSLDNIEPTELVPRGTAYIEDIAKAFEARNYMVMLTSLLTSLSMNVARFLRANKEIQVIIGFVIGFLVMSILKRFLTRQLIEEIAEVRPAKISFDGPLLMVNDVIIMNIGLKASRKIYEERGIAVEIIPKNPSASSTLSNIGQRQAIQHQAATQLGIRKDIDEPDFTPLARRNPHNGNLVMALIAMEPNVELLVNVVNKTPVLETCKRKPRGKYLKE
ncbi:YIEGIA family protein [Paramaledivibacter caminithermalis]|jgi:uncharacterized membrane protein YeaQ/YmgE (transglycosylase-associated protein family)|uniref:YIEGIA protein n=1 Tax=Paramaledivibacter caminithermalis (strain DSM 15212 / CIP 107654 / DViRD3) TaxID=1121301 RepID=A0A1M6S4H3_PARC5|nr:YIEGIA family protein [Paramaledivibacter caminithermalis]SHK39418.1 hypothetical protein SAMN02745912_03173 [Paramaledivibacter caminithermalis DSM 15212]